MIKRSPQMQKMMDDLACMIGLLPQKEAEDQGVCVLCKKPIGEFRDEVSRREYEITGTCQVCQDWLFSESEEEAEKEKSNASEAQG